ncbi:MAG TPA: thioredoxin family protein, partial [Chryseolinea sp.]|nr:thioredoxin family protein [Chryseolinea sp.]
MKTMKFFGLIGLVVVLISGKPLRYEIGDAVADFRLKNVDGKMVALSDYTVAKGAIVIFDCNTCPYSRAYNDRIIGLNKKYS